VFLGHIMLFAGLGRIGVPKKVGLIASTSVEVFIIISGFVITHLILTRQEAYLPYITRRFFRLFPTFAVCAVAGAFAIAVSLTPWTGDPAYEYGQQLVAFKAAQTEHLTPHFLLHLTMLHGVVPNNLLNVSQWAFLPPAWSLSLEWQFYLVAPAVLLLMRKPVGATIVSLFTAAGLFHYSSGRLGSFALPSILPGAAYLFLIGIASRMCCDRVHPSAPMAVSVAAIGVGFVMDHLAVGLWIAFFTFMFCDRRQLKGVDRHFVKLGDAIFSSKVANWAGKRTYCVYLVHFPVYQIVLTWLALAGLKSPASVSLSLLAGGFPLTMIAAELVHRYVELPGISVGRAIARTLTNRKIFPTMEPVAAE
jgi:peptidoglycan/LPS O-acetylase OafA/YrhL